MPHPTTRIALGAGLISLAALAACSGNDAQPTVNEPAPPSGPAAAPPATKPEVDGCGHYQVDVELPERYACSADADCGWTEHKPGSCLGPLCPGDYAEGNRQWIEAAEKLFERVCTGAEFRYCEKVKCINLIPGGAVCVDGRCTLKAEPPTDGPPSG